MTEGAAGMKVRVLEEAGIGTRELGMTATADGGYRCRVVAVPGTEWLHLVVYAGGSICFRCEVAVDGAEPVTLGLYPSGQGWRLDAGNQQVLVLPARSLDPLPPIPAPAATGTLPDDGSAGCCTQVVLVLDGTLRRFVRGKDRVWCAVALLGDPEEWPQVADGLSRLFAALANEDPALRWAMLSFADQQIPGIEAKGLKPEYRLAYPGGDDRLRLRPFAADGFGAALHQLGGSPSPGGDFVDALADALAACRVLDWRTGRKLVVVVGDSPGYSIQYPLGPGANACARCLDVDSEAMALHGMGVELVTLYQPPPPEALAEMDARARKLVLDAEQQYRRLASVPAYARRLDLEDMEVFAGELLARDFPIARGPCLGLPDQSGVAGSPGSVGLTEA